MIYVKDEILYKKKENKNAKECEKIKTKYHYYLIYICCVMYEIGLYTCMLYENFIIVQYSFSLYLRISDKVFLHLHIRRKFVIFLYY